MKKTLFSIALMLMTSIQLNAQDFQYTTDKFPETGCDLSITKAQKGKAAVRSGNVQIMRDGSLGAQVILDHSKTLIEGKPTLEYLQSRGTSWVEDWPKESREVAHHFGYQLGLRMKGNNHMQFDETVESNQTHLMVVHVTKMHLGSFAEGAFSLSLNLKKGGSTTSAVIEFINKATGEVDLVIEVNEIQGLGQETEERRRKSCADSMVGQILKLSK